MFRNLLSPSPQLRDRPVPFAVAHARLSARRPRLRLLLLLRAVAAAVAERSHVGFRPSPVCARCSRGEHRPRSRSRKMLTIWLFCQVEPPQKMSRTGCGQIGDLLVANSTAGPYVPACEMEEKCDH